MQKFTVFSIIFSISVVLILGDLVFHDYLNAETMGAGSASGAESQLKDFTNSGAELLNDDSTPDDITEETSEEVSLSEEVDLGLLNTNISEKPFFSAGFLEPTLKDTIFSGLVFQFIGFSDQVDAFVHQWNLFNAEDYIGSVYEIKYSTETGSFQGYLTLRDRAKELTNLGTVNEMNQYGDASFYFNHGVKTKTVHMVMKSGDTVYAFEYAYAQHEAMKKVFGLL